MTLSIIIVTHKSEKFIDNCLKSIVDSKISEEYEIIIVDNSEKEECFQHNVKTSFKYNANIKNLKCENKGFNHANNYGINHSKGEYILLLNPDTIVYENAIQEMVSIFKQHGHKKIGALGISLTDFSGELNTTRLFFPSIFDSFLRLFLLRTQKNSFVPCSDQKELLRVDSPIGAVFMIKKSLYISVGNLDEEYFLFFDELDYAMRIQKAGYKNYIYTGNKIAHYQGASTNSSSENSMIRNINSYELFMNKHYSKIKYKIILFIFILENTLKKKIKKENKFYEVNLKRIQEIKEERMK